MKTAFRLLTSAAAAFLVCIAFLTNASAEDVKIAMQGYDPVNYFTAGQPAKGKPEFSYAWDGERYLFASANHRDMFASDPARYAPQFPGHCAASLAGGQAVAPNPAYWIIVDGKLYLFGGEMGPDKFRAQPALIQKAEQNWRRTGKSAD